MPDPLAGWQEDFDPQFSAQNIEKDYRDYIHTLSPGEQRFVGLVFRYKDGTGQHALRIEIDVGGKDCWYHVLFYDKENNRVRVVKYFYGRYYLVSGIGYTFRHKKGSHELFVLTNAG